MPPKVELLFAGSDQGATATAIGVEEAVQAIGTSAEQASRSVTTGMSATLIAFRSVDQQVQQLTTDYRANLISQQQWQQGMAAARAQAIALRKETANLSANELRAFSGVIDRTAGASSAAGLKLNLLRDSTRALAQQAAGVQGPIGGFIQQLLMIAGGSQLAVGAAAAIGVLALTYRLLAGEAAKAEKEQQDAIDRLLKLRELAKSEAERQGEDVEKAKARLAELNAELAKLEATAPFRRGDSVLAFQIEQLIKERKRIEEAISSPADVEAKRERTENEKAYAAALKASGHQLTLLSIRLAHVGGERDAERLKLKAAELAYQGLTREQIANVLVNERQAIQLERQIAQLQELNRYIEKYGEGRRALNEFGLRLAEPPRDRPAAPPGRDTVDTDPLGQSEEFAHRLVDSFGLSIDMVEELKSTVDDLAETSVAALGDAFEHVFAAIVEGGRVSGAEMVAGLLRALSTAAIHEAAFYLARGFAALAGVTFPVANPKNAVAASQYFKAAAIMGAIGVGTGIAANVAGGGGGGGGLSPDRIRDTSRTAQENRGEVRVVVRGSAAVLARDPEFVRSVGEAFAEAAGTQQVTIEFEDGAAASVRHIGSRA